MTTMKTTPKISIGHVLVEYNTREKLTFIIVVCVVVSMVGGFGFWTSRTNVFTMVTVSSVMSLIVPGKFVIVCRGVVGG